MCLNSGAKGAGKGDGGSVKENIWAVVLLPFWGSGAKELRVVCELEMGGE